MKTHLSIIQNRPKKDFFLLLPISLTNFQGTKIKVGIILGNFRSFKEDQV